MNPTSSYKQTQHLLVFLLYLFVSLINGQTKPISFSYNKSSLKKGLQQLVGDYQLPLIYPSNLEDKKISAKCNSCTLDSALTLLLYNTNYSWKKINKQYTIYKIYSGPYTITGKIIDNVSNESIPYANVYIPSVDMGTISNDEGIFSLSGIESRICTVFVSYIGFETLETPIDFSSTQEPFIKIFLKQKIINSKNIFIRGRSREFMRLSNEPEKISFSPKHISTLPTIGEVDIFRALQLLPGIHQGLGGTAELYIRGGRPDQNLIIADGMPIYQKTHMFGFLSSIQAKAVKDIQVYKGGYPAKFGGRTSGLIQITNRAGNNISPHLRLYTNMTINSLQLEVPISSKGSFIVTSRNSNNIVSTRLYKSVKDFITGDDNFNLISVSANETQKTTYNPEFTFKDINAVLSYLISPKNRISLTYISGKDIINEKRDFIGFETILEYDSTTINEETEWSNEGAILNWSYYLSPDWQTKISISKTGFRSLYNSKQFDKSNNIDISPLQSLDEKNIFIDRIFTIRQIINSVSNHNLEIGLNKSLLSSDYKTIRTLDDISEELDIKQSGYLQTLYIQDNWSIINNVKLNLGLRNTYYSKTDRNYITPRFSISFRISPKIKFETSYGKYNQFVHQFNSPISTRGTKGTWLISNGKIPVINSSSSHSSIFWRDSDYDLSFSYYQRNSNGQYDFEKYISPIPILSNPTNTDYSFTADSTGTEKTAGGEIFIRRKNKQINGWIAYQLNNTKYSFDDIDNGQFFNADHDITHELKTIIITSILDYDVTANWSFSSGRVYTHQNEINITNDFQIIFNPGARNKERLNPVHHLDISISKKYIFKRLQLDAGLSIYNVYNRKNVSHKRYNPYTSGNIISEVIMLGITPTLFIQASL